MRLRVAITDKTKPNMSTLTPYQRKIFGTFQKNFMSFKLSNAFHSMLISFLFKFRLDFVRYVFPRKFWFHPKFGICNTCITFENQFFFKHAQLCVMEKFPINNKRRMNLILTNTLKYFVCLVSNGLKHVKFPSCCYLDILYKSLTFLS